MHLAATTFFSAGTGAEDLIAGVRSLSRGDVVGRFFPFFPSRDVDLRAWLSSWIEKSAVPVMTLNLQRGVAFGHPLPDAWHHQMVYGVDSEGETDYEMGVKQGKLCSGSKKFVPTAICVVTAFPTSSIAQPTRRRFTI